MSDPAPPEIAQAEIKVRRRQLSPIWVVPLITIAVAAWLTWDTLSKQGPMITITFESAEGLVAGQSQVKDKDVTLGEVEKVALSPDLTHVIVTARMTHDAESLLTDQAQFWVVRPRFFAGNISGFGTILSGPYIEMLPTTAGGKTRRRFTGLETPPVLQSTIPGHTFLLKAARLGSISLGSPVLYRGLNVGEVLGWDIANMADSVTIHAFIRSPFDKYVHEDTQFWDASGLSVKLGAEGVDVHVDSLQALLLGGIVFDTAPEARASPIGTENQVFTLYPNENAAISAGFQRRVKLLAYFPGSVEGLAVGAPVTLHGVRIGEVTDVKLVYDPRADAIVAPVSLEIQPGRIYGSAEAAKRGPLANVKILVAQGMRAQLQTINLLTGQKEIAFELVLNAPPAEVTVQGQDIVVPTAPGAFSGITTSVDRLLNNLEKMPFEQIGDNLNTMLAGLSKITNDPTLEQSLASLQVTLTSLHDLLTQASADAAPALHRLPKMAAALQNTLTSANQALAAANSGYGINSQFYRDLDRLLLQLNDMSQSLRVLADLLVSHPEALVRGRPDTGTAGP